jgi:hypothetical protein
MKLSPKAMMGIGALALCLALPAAWAQDTPPQGGMDQSAMGMHGDMHDRMKNMMGMHEMPATVTSVDTTTGMVEVMSENMPLKLHFPPASLANVKAGDKITIHMGFSKP